MKKELRLYAGCLLLIIIVFLFAALSAVNDTAAYLNHSTSVAVNRFQFGTYSLNPEINEVFTPGGGSLRVVKEVRVLNRTADDGSSTAAFVRVRLVPVFRTPGMGGAETTLMGTVEEPVGNTQSVTSPEGLQINLILSDNWSTNWFYSDGIFYYRQVVAPGNQTASLLNAVTAESAAAWDTFCIEVLAEAIQASPSELAEQAWGVVIENGIIQSK